MGREPRFKSLSGSLGGSLVKAKCRGETVRVMAG